MIINHLRTYLTDRTIGTLFIDGVQQQDKVIEDVGRPSGVKIAGETCIPEGVYKVTITQSKAFGRPMLLLSNMGDGTIQRDGTTWAGIRVHAGINTAHTAGCPLYASYKALQDDIQKRIDEDEPVYWIVSRE